jgi:hypothetical protein
MSSAIGGGCLLRYGQPDDPQRETEWRTVPTSCTARGARQTRQPLSVAH